jgi:hypothetical protein
MKGMDESPFTIIIQIQMIYYKTIGATTDRRLELESKGFSDSGRSMVCNELGSRGVDDDGERDVNGGLSRRVISDA